MLDQIKSKLRYMAVGDPSKRDIVSSIDAPTGQVSGSEIVDNNPGVLTRISQVLKGENVNSVAEPRPARSLAQMQEHIAPIAPPITPTATPTPTPSDPTQQILNKYQIPPAVFYGMKDAEGGVLGSNNPMNIGAFDSNPTAAVDYNTPEAGIEAFAKLIATDPRYKKAYALRSNPDAMLAAVMDAGYAGDPTTWKERSANTGGAGKTYDSYAEFVKDTPGWRKNHKK